MMLSLFQITGYIFAISFPQATVEQRAAKQYLLSLIFPISEYNTSYMLAKYMLLVLFHNNP